MFDFLRSAMGLLRGRRTRVLLPRASSMDELEPLGWFPLAVRKYGDVSPHRGTALIRCGQGHLSVLASHRIGPGGLVDPRVRCPVKGCDWRAYVQLGGWQ